MLAQTFLSAIFASARGYPSNLLFAYGIMAGHLRSNLTRRSSLSRCDRENSYSYPNHVHERRRIRSVKDCVYGQEKAAYDIKALISVCVSFQFLGRNHCISEKL